MAKNCKKLLPENTKPALETDLKQSFKDLLQLDDTLKNLIKEREDLEQQIKALSGVSESGSTPDSEIFEQPIESFQTKRKRDKKQFETKRKLEEKIAAKKLAFKHWENKRNKLNQKVKKTEGLIKNPKSIKDDFQKDDFEARWQEKRNVFKDRITKKPKDIWSEKRDKQKKSVFSKIKEPIRKKVTKKIAQNPKVKKVKDQWELLRDKNREAKKLKAKEDKKWNDIQKKSMVDAFDVLPKEAKNELKQFEDDFKKSAQKEKDEFEEKQQKLKDKLKAKASNLKESLTSKKKTEEKEAKKKEEQQKGLNKNRVEEKREEDRQKRQTKLQEDKKKERNREQKREQRREERKNRKKDKYA
jgi:hypothetical protein